MDHAEPRLADIVGVVSDRGWFACKELLKIKDTEWAHKMILDVGSGKKFGDPQKAFPGATIHAVDPSFFTGGQEKYNHLGEIEKRNLIVHPTENTAPNVIKARAQNLPYANQSFDLVMSVMAVPMNVPEADQIDALKEMLRVTKHGGEVRFWPAPEEHFADFFTNLRTQGYRVDPIGADGKGWCIRVPIPTS